MELHLTVSRGGWGEAEAVGSRPGMQAARVQAPLGGRHGGGRGCRCHKGDQAAGEQVVWEGKRAPCTLLSPLPLLSLL